MTFFLILFWQGLIATGLAQTPVSRRLTDGYPRQPAFDVLHYNLSLTVSDNSNVVRGKTIITVHRLDPTDTTLALDLKNMTVTALQVGHVTGKYVQRDGRLDVVLPAGRGRDDTLLLAIQYHGEPADGLYLRENKFRRRTIFADNWPDRARYWFPGIDHPYDKATVEFHITVPERHTVVATGRLEQERHNLDGTKTWSWRESVPIPTYCMVFGAAEFSVLHFGEVMNIPVSYYVFPGDAAVAEQSFGRTEQILQFFSNRIGPYPYEKLALVQSLTRFGAMENASAIFFAEAALGARRTEGTSVHEIAHQWFGDSITKADWHHLWLSEGFATYFDALFYEDVEDEVSFREEMRRNRDDYLKFARTKLRPILDTTVTDYFDLLNANNYQKAGWVLHMLRHLIGTESFWQGIRDYYRAFKNGNALTDDFRRIMERVSGEELGWFFQQWLWQPGHPVIKWDWRWLPREKSVELMIRQLQTGTFFRLPLEIEILSAGEKTRYDFWMERSEVNLKVPQDKKPEQIVLDPDEKILMEVLE
ncbi:MAG: M1 family metallopeptidase [candidate division KSB1 bacterium]|nr:M1 family metallopeptidase [candidate division KSB1 bacterium]